jgi:hypothetical protein
MLYTQILKIAYIVFIYICRAKFGVSGKSSKKEIRSSMIERSLEVHELQTEKQLRERI